MRLLILIVCFLSFWQLPNDAAAKPRKLACYATIVELRNFSTELPESLSDHMAKSNDIPADDLSTWTIAALIALLSKSRHPSSNLFFEYVSQGSWNKLLDKLSDPVELDRIRKKMHAFFRLSNEQEQILNQMQIADPDLYENLQSQARPWIHFWRILLAYSHYSKLETASDNHRIIVFDTNMLVLDRLENGRNSAETVISELKSAEGQKVKAAIVLENLAEFGFGKRVRDQEIEFVKPKLRSHPHISILAEEFQKRRLADRRTRDGEGVTTDDRFLAQAVINGYEFFTEDLALFRSLVEYQNDVATNVEFTQIGEKTFAKVQGEIWVEAKAYRFSVFAPSDHRFFQGLALQDSLTPATVQSP